MSPPPEPRSDKSRQSEHPQITTMTKAPPSIRRRGFPLPAHPHRQRLPRPQRKRRVTVPLAARLVEVIADLGESAAERYRYGSGCIVRGGTVLTAAHIVAGAVTVRVRDPDKRI